MAKYDGWTIEVLNWKKFNPRTDVKASSWYRKAHLIHFDPAWGHFKAEELHVWDFFLALASMKNQSVFEYTPEILARAARVRIKVFESAVQKLERMGCVRVTDASRGRNGNVALRTDGRTDETDGDGRTGTGATDDPPPPPQETHPLQEIWNRHRGKLPECRSMSENRQEAAEKLWSKNPSTEYWSNVVMRMAASAFCRGEKNKPGKFEDWKADFDFLIDEETHIKVMERKYDDRPSDQASGGSGRQDEAEIVEAISKIVAGISAIGPHQTERAREFIGALGWEIVTSEGGWIRTCEKLNDFNVATLKSQWRNFLLARGQKARGAA